MIQNGTKSDHLDLLGGPGGEMVQNGIKSEHLDRLGGPGGEMVQNDNKSDHLDRFVLQFYEICQQVVMEKSASVSCFNIIRFVSKWYWKNR